MNQMSSQLRCCYSNDVKSAKDLKISMKGSNAYFYPTVPFSVTRGAPDDRLDMRFKRPLSNMQADPLQVIDDGGAAETLYNGELDKFMLDNQGTIERNKTHRGVARLYCILLYRDPKLDSGSSNNAMRFRLNVSTGFIVKVGKIKYLVSTLSVVQHPQELMKLPGSKSFVLASFGNRDLVPYIFQTLKDQR
jgi:hypothetical protein